MFSVPSGPGGCKILPVHAFDGVGVMVLLASTIVSTSDVVSQGFPVPPWCKLEIFRLFFVIVVQCTDQLNPNNTFVSIPLIYYYISSR